MVIAKQQWSLLLRRRQAWVLGGALLFALLLSLWCTRQSLDRQHVAAAHNTEEEAEVWASQGQANPHGAAHFGRLVYKPRPALAVLDPGLSGQLGEAVKLEGHNRYPAQFRPREAGTALSSFMALSPAFVLQVLAPLLIILAGFSTFSGETARRLLAQEVGCGMRPVCLALGKLVGFSAVVLTGLLSFGLVAAVTVELSPTAAIMGLAYTVYLVCYIAVTFTVSALCRSARTSLLILLAIWAVTTWLVPRMAPMVAQQLHPVPSAVAFEAAVTAEVMTGPDGHNPRDARLAAFKAATLQQYGVSRTEDLPFDYGGLVFEYGESFSTEIYNRHFSRLYDGFDAQADVIRGLAWLSPLLPLRPLSARLAQTDLNAHRSFLEQADAYRYATVQALNRDIKLHRKNDKQIYMSDVASITANQHFSPKQLSADELLRGAIADFGLLGLWLLASIGALMLAARRLGTRQ